MVELARGNDGRFGMSCGGDTFNTAVYLARAGIDCASRPPSATIPTPTAWSRWRRPRREDRPDAARAGPPARPLHRSTPTPRASDASATGAAKHQRASCSSFRTGPDRREHDGRQLIYFSGVTLSLYSNVGLGRSRRRRVGAPAGRQDRVRRQLPPARLEGRSAAHAHGVHGSAQARRLSRCRPSTTKRCCGATRAPKPRSSGCRRSASARSW